MAAETAGTAMETTGAAESAPASAAMADVVGWYSLQWKGGAFEVCFRPVGRFFCPRFQAPATWQMEGNVINLDWAKFGKYQFTFDPASKHMEGFALPENKDDEKNWRKADFLRPLSAQESALIGDGAGSEWDFEWSGGKFPVQFKADGYNHFKCEDFPAHAHWAWDQQKELLTIHWDQYGTYEMKINGAEKTMEGSAKGAPDDWRKAELLRNLIDNKVVEACEYKH
jgi:hypothetical protein